MSNSPTVPTVPTVPTDVIRQIFLYVGDIDLRRYFGFYQKIDLSQYSILETITRKINPKFYRERANYLYRQYDLCNIHADLQRKEQNIENDTIDMKIAFHDGMVMYNYGIYRLKPNNQYNQARLLSYKYKGNLDSYSWYYLLYSYNLK